MMIFNPSLGSSAATASQPEIQVRICRIQPNMFVSSGLTDRPYQVLVPLANFNVDGGDPVLWWGPTNDVFMNRVADIQLLATDIAYNPDDPDDQNIYLFMTATRIPTLNFNIQVVWTYVTVDESSGSQGGGTTS